MSQAIESPTQLKVGTVTYRIDWVARIGATDKGEDIWGQHSATIADGDVIKVVNQLSEPRAKETLLHEILHSLADFTGYEHDEAYVNRMSQGLFLIMRDNPEVMRWLLA